MHRLSRFSGCLQVAPSRASPIFVPKRTVLEGPKRTILWELEKEKTLEVLNPATAEAIRTLPIDNLQTLTEKFRRAKDFGQRWNDVPFEERCRIIRRFGESLLQNADSLAATLTSEMGKPITQAKSEVKATADRIKFFLDHTESVSKDLVMRVLEDGRMTEKVTYEPLGIVLNISAWNYPFFVGSNVWIPALLTGNTVIYKPSEHAVLTGLNVAHLLHSAGVPESAFITLIGRATVGSIATTMPVDGIFFTGSHATGRTISKMAGSQMIKYQLELGGKCPVYITDDVDVEWAAKAVAEGAFYNTGQSCCAVDRIYVHRKVYDSFESAFVKEVAGFKVGIDPMDPEAFIGPLARERQLGFLEHLVNHAVRRGAELLIGGKRMTLWEGKPTKGFFFEPTVLGHCNHTMEIMHRESFGPIVGLQKVNNDDDAVSLMNDNLFGLAASVYTNNEERAMELLREVKTGTSYWNACDRVSPYLPWTGLKHSGFGSTLGLDGIRQFVRPRSWHLRQPPARPSTREQAASQEQWGSHPLAPPNADAFQDTAQSTFGMEITHGNGPDKITKFLDVTPQLKEQAPIVHPKPTYTADELQQQQKQLQEHRAKRAKEKKKGNKNDNTKDGKE